MSGFIDQASAFSTMHKDLIDTFFKLIGGSAALLGAWLGLRKFLQDKAWQSKQFAYDYSEKIMKEPEVRLALRMLDWTNGSASDEEAKLLGIDSLEWDATVIAKALECHEDRPGGLFNKVEYAVRSAFDALLERMDRLGDFLESGILQETDFPANLRYYIDLLNEDRLDPIRPMLATYMLRYGFKKTHRMFRTFGARGF